MRKTTRRELIVAAGATAYAAAVPPAWGRLTSRRVGIGPGEFLDGVASGEPGPQAVTFWSRLRTDRPRTGARLIVARDEDLNDVVAVTKVPSGRGVNHTLKARVGGLEPSTDYFFAWESSTSTSEVGHTRTQPPPGAAVPLRMAFSSCQSYNQGYFGAHSHAAREALDLYVFLGDYVYERGRVSAQAIRTDRIDAVDLKSYRRKYQLYRSDPELRELHRVHPMMHVWDDHEIENNYTQNDPTPHPAQRLAGYRAAFEWLPRMVFPEDRFRIYKKLSYGATADVFFLDTRQYRQGHNDGRPRKLLGDAQMSWLINELRASTAVWKVVAQQVVISQDPYGTGESEDQWDGHPGDRLQLLGAIEQAGIRNVVFLTGDAHVYMVNRLATDFDDLANRPSRVPAGIEYLGGSVTSPGSSRSEAEVQEAVPWNVQFNGGDHGYALMAMDGANLVTEYRRADFTQPNGAVEAFERFVQPAGANQVARERLAPSV